MGERLQTVNPENGKRRKELLTSLGRMKLLTDATGLQKLVEKVDSFMGNDYLVVRAKEGTSDYVEVYASINDGNLRVGFFPEKVSICYHDKVGRTVFSSQSPVSGVGEMGRLGDRSLLLFLKEGGSVGIDKEFGGITIRSSQYSGPRD